MKAEGTNKKMEFSTEVFENRTDFFLSMINSLEGETLMTVLEFYSEMILKNEMLVAETEDGKVIVTEMYPFK